MSANFATIIGTPVTPSQRDIPPRFYLAMGFIYALVIVPYLTVYTSWGWSSISSVWVNPVFTFVTAAAAATLLLLGIGMGELSRPVLVRCLILVFVLGVAVDVAEVSISYVSQGGQIDWQVMQNVPRLYETQPNWLDAIIEIALVIGTVVVEECAKLLPVLALIAFGKIRSMQAGMGCAALAGLVFGLIESNVYGYINLPGMQLSEYLMRYFSMSITHALWDALGAGMAFWFARKISHPTFSTCMYGFVVTCMLHLLHNALQALITPTVQAITICFLLLPVYMLAKSARRKSLVPEDFAFEIPIAGFLTALLSVASLAATQMSVKNVRLASQVADYAQTVNEIQSMLHGKEADAAESTIHEMSTRDIPFPNVREDLLDALRPIRDGNSSLFDGVDRTYAMSLDSPRISPNLIDSAIAKRQPYLKLDDARHELNRANAAAGLQTPFKGIRRWEIEIESVTPSDAVTRIVNGNGELRVLLASGARLEDTLFPALQSEAFSFHRAFLPWQTSLSLADDRPVLILYDRTAGYILDATILPWADVSTAVHMSRGSLIHLSVHYDAQ